jgi:hypothetical protein
LFRGHPQRQDPGSSSSGERPLRTIRGAPSAESVSIGSSSSAGTTSNRFWPNTSLTIVHIVLWISGLHYACQRRRIRSTIQTRQGCEERRSSADLSASTDSSPDLIGWGYRHQQVRKSIRGRYATSSYSWISPPRRSCRRIRGRDWSVVPREGGSAVTRVPETAPGISWEMP